MFTGTNVSSELEALKYNFLFLVPINKGFNTNKNLHLKTFVQKHPSVLSPILKYLFLKEAKHIVLDEELL